MIDFLSKFDHLANLLSKEYNVPNFRTVDLKRKDAEKARYLYVYICRVHLNSRFSLIKQSLPVYTYPKTVYQVMKRIWQRRKQPEIKADIDFIVSKLQELQD